MDKQDLYKVEIELCRIVLDANELDKDQLKERINSLYLSVRQTNELEENEFKSSNEYGENKFHSIQLSILYRQLKEAVEDKRTCQFCKHVNNACFNCEFESIF